MVYQIRYAKFISTVRYDTYMIFKYDYISTLPLLYGRDISGQFCRSMRKIDLQVFDSPKVDVLIRLIDHIFTWVCFYILLHKLHNRMILMEIKLSGIYCWVSAASKRRRAQQYISDSLNYALVIRKDTQILPSDPPSALWHCPPARSCRSRGRRRGLRWTGPSLHSALQGVWSLRRHLSSL